MAKFSASVAINAKSNMKGVAKDIDKSLKKNNASLKKNQKSWERSTKAMKGFGKVALAGTTVAVAGSIALIKSTANLGDELQKTSEKTGVAIDELQKLRYAAKLGGASSNDLSTGLRVFSRAIDEASQGTTEYKEAFDRLGVSVIGSDGKLRDSVDVLHDISDVFARVEDGAQKTSIAQQLFGRGGSALIPTLNEGSEAMKGYGNELEKIGFIMTKEQAEASEQFNDDLARLTTSIKGLGTSIAVDAIKPLNDFTNKIREAMPAIRSWFDDNVDIAKFLEGIADVVDKIDLNEVFDVSLEGAKSVLDDLGTIMSDLRSVSDFLSDPIGLGALSESRTRKTEAEERLARQQAKFPEAARIVIEDNRSVRVEENGGYQKPIYTGVGFIMTPEL